MTLDTVHVPYQIVCPPVSVRCSGRMGGLWSSTSVSRPPIDKLLQELGKPDGRMADLRSKVGINSEKQVRLEKEPLGRSALSFYIHLLPNCS